MVFFLYLSYEAPSLSFMKRKYQESKVANRPAVEAKKKAEAQRTPSETHLLYKADLKATLSFGVDVGKCSDLCSFASLREK